jgi:hypothetical protein
MSEKSIERILRGDYAPELPYGFAERVARNAMVEGTSAFWELLLSLTPSTGLALGALGLLLVVLGFAGSGPGLFESIDHYSTFSSVIAFP